MDEPKNPQLNIESPTVASGFSKKEKLAFSGFVLLAILIVYLGFRQMGNNLKTPFALFALKYSGGEETELTESELMEQAKIKDTDQDGLSDYDELYIYSTSPYLTDSDSDEINDKQEVDAGTDPNCPKGQNCYSSEITNPVSGQITTSTLKNPVEVVPSAEQLALQAIFTTNPDAATIRSFLTSNGADAQILNQVSDEELVAWFKEFMTSTTSTLNAGSSGSLEEFNTLVNNLDTATAEVNTISSGQVDLKSLREILKTNGVPEETLNQLDDQTLLDLIKDL